MASDTEIVGATIAGKYVVRRVVGRGSMGVVCEAEHLEIGKRVAIKLIDASLAGMTDIAIRFRQEARATSLVESHHIVQVFDVGTDERLGLYLVMEFLTGEDLATVLARDHQLPLDRSVRIAIQVARGLAKAHEAGVVHRDLKPANIFLCTSEDEHPLVKILDFGVSKVVDSARGGSGPGLKLTRDGMVLGTPQYMSPEQAQGYTVDERTDVWALGLVLYEMLAGRPAYPELPSYEQFIIHLVSHPPDPLPRVAPWVTDELASVVHGALEHDPKARIQNCSEFVKRLSDAYPVHPGRSTLPPVSETTDTWSDPQPFDRRDGSTAPRRDRRTPSCSSASDTAPSENPRRSGEPLPAQTPRLGVRGTVADAPLEDFQEDAPQFFDRKMLQTLDPPAARTLPEASHVTVLNEPTVAARAGSAHSSRFPRGWAGLALLVLGLVLVAALAWR
jgi:serine/threonine protein kinase